jgi:hypothetical protein
MKCPTKRLIIWRSLVQAQAGPQTKRLILNRIELFFVEHLQIIRCCSNQLSPPFKAFVSLLFHQLNNMQYADNQSRNRKNPKTIK